MKKTLKLIPAIAMLLISTILVSTATYAWFTMSASVTASGMKVQAKVTGSLYIIKDTGTVPAYTTINDTTADFSADTMTALAPTSTINLTNWYKATAAAPGAYEKDSAVNYEAVTDGEINNYRLVKTAYVRAAANFTSLKVTGLTVSYTGTDTYGFNEAVTVAVRCSAINEQGVAISTKGTGKTVYIANEVLGDRNGAIEVDTGNTGKVNTTAVSFVQAAASGMTAEILDASVSGSTPAIDNANQVYKVEFFIYFDGMSNSCYTNAVLNTVNTNGYSIAATLSASGGEFGA